MPFAIIEVSGISFLFIQNPIAITVPTVCLSVTVVVLRLLT